MFERILVAYDEGKVAKTALDKAIELAKSTSAEIYLISIYNDNDVQSTRLQGFEYPADAGKLFNPKTEEMTAAKHKYIESLLADPIAKVIQAGVPVHCEIKEGKPSLAIIEYAKEICADLIVVGTHNRGSAARLILGSVANDIIHSAPCPVMVVREQ